MQIQFNTYKIHEAYVLDSSLVGAGLSYSIEMGLGGTPPFPSERVEVKSADEIAEKFAAYCERVKAGCTIPVQASWFRPANDRSRAFPGFSKLKEDKANVNINTDAIDAAAWEKFRAKQPA